LKKAFSLIELMIVIVIIGVIYTLAIEKLDNVAEEKMKPNFLNLKEYLQSFIKEDVKEARLLCLDDCSSCDIYVDNVKTQSVEHFLDDSLEVYRYDFLQGAIRKKEEVFFNEEDVQESVCFSFRVDNLGVADQVFVVYKEKAYDYTNFFEPTQVYDNLEELVDYKESLAQEVK